MIETMASIRLGDILVIKKQQWNNSKVAIVFEVGYGYLGLQEVECEDDKIDIWNLISVHKDDIHEVEWIMIQGNIKDIVGGYVKW